VEAGRLEVGVRRWELGGRRLMKGIE